jgi:adenylate cyclase
MADLFVSYSRADRARVGPLVSALEAEGWSVWWDPEIDPGQDFDRLIAEQLDQARAVIAVWTPTSVISRWVRGEAREAADRGVLAPVRFERAHLPIDLRAIHTTDLDDWGEDTKNPAFRELVRALRTLLRETGAQPAATAAATRLSICVLPFGNLSGDPEQEYFSDGITEDIITDLSQISSLFVVARNTAFTYKNKSVAIGQVARQLGVTHMLEGSVRKAGNRVRITAQLIDGASEGHLWAKRWDRDLDDIFALQDEISEAIVAALKLKLLPEEKQAIEKRGTSNAEATGPRRPPRPARRRSRPGLRTRLGLDRSFRSRHRQCLFRQGRSLQSGVGCRRPGPQPRSRLGRRPRRQDAPADQRRPLRRGPGGDRNRLAPGAGVALRQLRRRNVGHDHSAVRGLRSFQ